MLVTAHNQTPKQMPSEQVANYAKSTAGPNSAYTLYSQQQNQCNNTYTPPRKRPNTPNATAISPRSPLRIRVLEILLCPSLENIGRISSILD